MIELKDIAIAQGGFVLEGVDVLVPSGQYAVLMGQTGSGKTTLLELVCGLRPPTAGRIVLCGCDVTDLPPAARGVGYVPQDGALFKRMRVEEQIAFALMVRHADATLIRERVDRLSALLGIESLLERRPEGLSGGERQRVALARALAFKPGILLLDEPLSALDDSTRAQAMAMLKNVQKETGVTVLHVTHSLHEADQLADIRLAIRDRKVEAVESEDAYATEEKSDER